MKGLANRLRLIVIADRGRVHDGELCRRAEEALDAGAPALQLRDKASGAGDGLQIARELAEACRVRGALFFVNDRLDLALAAGADGVHVGPEDPPVAAIRRVAGSDFLIGASAGTTVEAVQAVADGADYLGCGSVFSTGSKPDAGAPIGLEGLQAVSRAVDVPVVAIGGLTPETAGLVYETGAAGCAVISAIMGPEPVARAVRALLAPWTGRDG
ncbi:MAG: thiamine phosphate synthase [Gemmatimonadetes bacterium]|nr:thiamine phosphate synthase [Gemmatimonadota bacterium]